MSSFIELSVAYKLVTSNHQLSAFASSERTLKCATPLDYSIFAGITRYSFLRKILDLPLESSQI
jgi:hypothetical protein